MQETAQPQLLLSESLAPHLDWFAFSFAIVVTLASFSSLLRGLSLLALVGCFASPCLFYTSHLLCVDPRNVRPFLVLSLIILLAASTQYYTSFVFIPGGWLMLNSILMILRYGERLLFIRNESEQKVSVIDNKKSQ